MVAQDGKVAGAGLEEGRNVTESSDGCSDGEKQIAMASRCGIIKVRWTCTEAAGRTNAMPCYFSFFSSSILMRSDFRNFKS